MSTLYTLLITALSLKAAILGMPNIDSEFKAQALKIADSAIEYSNQQLAVASSVKPVEPVIVQTAQAVEPAVIPLSFVSQPQFKVHASYDSGNKQTVMYVIAEFETNKQSTAEITIGSTRQGYSSEATKHTVTSGEISGGTHTFTLIVRNGADTLTVVKTLSQCYPSNGESLPVKPLYDSCAQ